MNRICILLSRFVAENVDFFRLFVSFPFPHHNVNRIPGLTSIQAFAMNSSLLNLHDDYDDTGADP